MELKKDLIREIVFLEEREEQSVLHCLFGGFSEKFLATKADFGLSAIGSDISVKFKFFAN